MKESWVEASHSPISKTAAASGMIIGLILQYNTADKYLEYFIWREGPTHQDPP